MFVALSRYATHNPKTILLLTALFAAAGVYALRTLPIEAYPDVTDPMVEVVTVFPGQSAEDVERQVSLELERVLAGTPHLTNLRTVSVFGLSLVTLRFDDASSEFENRVRVMERLREAELPEGVEAEIGPMATPVGQIYRYTLRGPRSLRELRSLQDWVVERRLRSVPGVADVDTFGGFERQYAVRIDPNRLGNMQVSIAEVFSALDAMNQNAPGGYVGIGSQEFVVRGVGILQDPKEIGAALVKERDGVPIRIRDVADVLESSVPRRGSVGRGGDDEVVEGIVLLRRGENANDVLEAIRARVEELNEQILPPDVQIDTFIDRGELIGYAVSTVGNNLLHGALLVVLIIFVFLRSWQAAFIVGAVIPLVMLSSFIGLRALGMSANLISLGAIDFGILVESTAVVLEVTLHGLAALQGVTGARIDRVGRQRAILDAIASVTRPVTFATLIIIVGLVPLFLLERVEGRIFAPMAFTYVFALVGARIAATTVVPALMTLMLPAQVPTDEARWFHWLQERYVALLTRLARVRLVVVAGLAATAVLLGVYARGIGVEFLPPLNEGGLYITAVFPSGISLDETRVHVPAIRRRLMALPEALDVLSHIGRPEDARQTEGPNNAEFFVRLAPMEEWRRGLRIEDFEAELRESLADVPGVQYNFSQPIADRVFETISGIVGQVVVKVQGEDLAFGTALAERIETRLAGVPGVVDLGIFQAGDVPHLQIDLDRDRLAERGLTIEDVQHVVAVALGGKLATEIWEGERRYGVAVRVPDAVRRDADALGRLVVGEGERRVTLGEVAEIQVTRGRAFIWRENLTRFVALKFNIHDRDLGSVVGEGRRAIADLVEDLPSGVRVTWGGEFENKERAMARLAVVVPITLVVMIMLLYLNFRRITPALLILSLLPVASLSSVAGLRLSGEHFSVSAAVGVITLLGQVALSGVLVCTRIDLAARAGALDPRIEGAKTALRPVLLTVTLAAMGLVPLALSHGIGSESQRPFAIAIIGGLLAGFPMVMCFMPLFYRPPVGTQERDGDDGDDGDEGAGRHPLTVGALGVILAVALGLPGLASAQAPQPGAPAPSPETVAQRTAATDALAVDERALLVRWLRNSREVASWRSEVGAARFDVVTARMLPNPSVNVGTMISPIGVPPDGRYNFGGELEMELPIFGQIRGRREAAQRALSVAEMALAVQLWDRIAEIRVAALGRAFQHARVESIEQAIEEIAEVRRVISARSEAGVGTAYDALRVSTQHEMLLASAEIARLDRSEAEVELLTQIADPTLRHAPVRREGLAQFSGPESAEALLARALELRPDLHLAKRSVRAFEAVAQQHRVDAIPAPLLFLGGWGTIEDSSFSVVAGVSIPLPVFNRNQGEIGRALALADGQRALIEAVTARIRVEVGVAWERRERARLALSRFRESGVAVSDDLVVRARRAYQAGTFSITELLDAFEAVWEARERALELERELYEAEIALERAAALRAPVPGSNAAE